MDFPTGTIPLEEFIRIATLLDKHGVADIHCPASPRDPYSYCGVFRQRLQKDNLLSPTVPIYPDFRSMAIANGVPPDHPALVLCRDAS
jgi:hypothetical protein